MRNRSIRFKLTLWYLFLLILLVGLTFAVTRLASGIVLQSTIRDYLISTVEENVNKISYIERRANTGANVYIPYEEGFLEIDDDFLDMVSDVHSALYRADGVMIYGENPLALQMGNRAFEMTHTFILEVGDTKYSIYDRKLDVGLPSGEELWIRGIVPDTRSAAQLNEITRISLILLPILLLLGAFASYFLAGRMLRSLQTIEQAATTISRGSDLKQRLDVRNNNDEVGRLAAAFNHMIERLDEAFEKERRFTSDASHELRTPTSVILAQAEYALEKPRSVEDYEDALRVVQRQGKRMSVLINDMLDYTRMDQRAEQYTMEEMDLSSAVGDMAEQMRMLGTNGITLHARITPDIKILGNSMLISRLTQNLISNAYQYGRPGGEIHVCVEEADDLAVLSVRDNGIGIAAEEQEKIFDRFYRSDASRSVQGTGLGLSMVKKIADLHGAELKLESEPGQGSEFRLIFKKLVSF